MSTSNASSDPLSPFIQKFKVIRPILQLFSHGCYHRKACKQLGFHQKKYDKDINFLQQYLPDGYLVETKTGKQVVIHFPNDSYRILDNQLSNMFSSKTIKVTQIFFYVFLMLIFQRAQKPLRFPEIKQALELDIYDACTQAMPDAYVGKDKPLRDFLDHLAQEGILTKTGKNKTVQYTLVEDIFATLSQSEMAELYDAIRFYRNVGIINVPGFYLQHTLEQRATIPQRQFVQIKNNNFVRITDDEVITKLLPYIGSHQGITFTYSTTPTDMFDKENQPHGQRHTGIPLQIKTDYMYARQYLVIQEKKSIETYRLDRVQDIKPNTTPITEKPMNKTATPKVRQIPIALYYETPEEETYIANRIHEQFPDTVITKDTDTQSHCELTVTDPRNFLPWLRTLHPHTQILPSENKTVEDMRQRMIESIKGALANYGII